MCLKRLSVALNETAREALGGVAMLAMIAIPSGAYTPLYRSAPDAPKRRQVAAFRLDQYPVTVAQYLIFLRKHPRWRRSSIQKKFADRSYLSEWKGDLEPGPAVNHKGPVTGVSWYAARAYCRSLGEDLPSLDQWEYAAAPESYPGMRSLAHARQAVLDWDSKPVSEPLPPVGSGVVDRWGVHDLHGLVWEWVLDFRQSGMKMESGAKMKAMMKAPSAFCAAGSQGANLVTDYAAFMRFAFRSSLTARRSTRKLGFRCARPLRLQ